LSKPPERFKRYLNILGKLCDGDAGMPSRKLHLLKGLSPAIARLGENLPKGEYQANIF
jgi:hypothetical protein